MTYFQAGDLLLFLLLFKTFLINRIKKEKLYQILQKKSLEY